MLECNGIITIAFRRYFIEIGTTKFLSDIDGQEPTDISDVWMTSPYSHIEPAISFQLGLPILILREKGVKADGILEKGVTGTYLPEFDLNDETQNYLRSEEFLQIIETWKGYVRQVARKKGIPLIIYNY